MKKKIIYNTLKINAIAAVSLVCLGYWIDTDPPYDNTWLTVMEFCLLTLGVFTLLSLFFLSTYYITALLLKEPRG
ncbi:MAG: hypothetical protein ABJM06_02920 [Gilvibacter sp.]